jgi:prepilin-type N-terminal cleavage/methylation domain-containing protein/prepilin-type processing-associated H-X9-DG protein
MRSNIRNRRGFTLAELMVVTTIISSLGAATGGWIGVQDQAKQTACASNLSQIGKAVQMFAMDNDGRLPNARFFPDLKGPANDPRDIRNILKPYVVSTLFVCPGAPEQLRKFGISYVWNDLVSNADLDTLPNASQIVLMADACSTIGKAPHNGGYEILYADGHVKWAPTAPNWRAGAR